MHRFEIVNNMQKLAGTQSRAGRIRVRSGQSQPLVNSGGHFDFLRNDIVDSLLFSHKPSFHHLPPPKPTEESRMCPAPICAWGKPFEITDAGQEARAVPVAKFLGLNQLVGSWNRKLSTQKHLWPGGDFHVAQPCLGRALGLLIHARK